MGVETSRVGPRMNDAGGRVSYDARVSKAKDVFANVWGMRDLSFYKVKPSKVPAEVRTKIQREGHVYAYGGGDRAVYLVVNKDSSGQVLPPQLFSPQGTLEATGTLSAPGRRQTVTWDGAPGDPLAVRYRHGNTLVSSASYIEGKQTDTFTQLAGRNPVTIEDVRVEQESDHQSMAWYLSNALNEKKTATAGGQFVAADQIHSTSAHGYFASLASKVPGDWTAEAVTYPGPNGQQQQSLHIAFSNRGHAFSGDANWLDTFATLVGGELIVDSRTGLNSPTLDLNHGLNAWAHGSFGKPYTKLDMYFTQAATDKWTQATPEQVIGLLFSATGLHLTDHQAQVLAEVERRWPPETRHPLEGRRLIEFEKFVRDVERPVGPDGRRHAGEFEVGGIIALLDRADLAIAYRELLQKTGDPGFNWNDAFARLQAEPAFGPYANAGNLFPQIQIAAAIAGTENIVLKEMSMIDVDPTNRDPAKRGPKHVDIVYKSPSVNPPPSFDDYVNAALNGP